MSARTCSDCPAAITSQSKGRCRACANRHGRLDAARETKRLAALRASKADPEYRALMSRMNKERHRRLRHDPAWRQFLVERGRELQAHYQASPEAQAKRRAATADIGSIMHEARMGWCPKELRGEYRRLTRSKRMSAAEARAEIYRQIEEARRARLNPEAAADFLRRLGPILRCTEDGALTPAGGFWRRGLHVLSDGDVIDRAIRVGWEPDRSTHP